MNFEEFLEPNAESAQPNSTDEISSVKAEVVAQEEEVTSVDLDVQKAVVESLAADKAEQEETIKILRDENAALKNEIESLKQKIVEQNVALEKVGDVLFKNTETKTSNQISLLDRNLELPDRFPGETRDQVIEAIKEAKDRADSEGRVRRAQLLESVLVVNESSGNLEKKREALIKFFNDNQNILTGPVIGELEKYGISHKKGDEYLLPSEIVKRTY